MKLNTHSLLEVNIPRKKKGYKSWSHEKTAALGRHIEIRNPMNQKRKNRKESGSLTERGKARRFHLQAK